MLIDRLRLFVVYVAVDGEIAGGFAGSKACPERSRRGCPAGGHGGALGQFIVAVIVLGDNVCSKLILHVRQHVPVRFIGADDG